MTNELKRFFVYCASFIGALGYLIYRFVFLDFATILHTELLVPLTLTVITTCFIGVYETIKCQGKYFWIALRCSLLIPTKITYVSLSYLLRIKLTGSECYFLVKGSKIEQYQPIGGVYKLVGKKDITKDWGAHPKSDNKNPKDLRFFVNAKHIPDIIRWFKSKKDREFGVWREFYEEIIETGILKGENFKTIQAEYLSSHENILSKQNRFDNEEYHTLIYDIFQIELSAKQSEELDALMSKNIFNDRYAFVTKNEIEKECFQDHKLRIGQHTKFIV